MFKDAGPIDAASILLNLTDYRVIVVTEESAGRQVLVEPSETEAACPTCGVLTSRIQARPEHRIKDLPIGRSDLQVVVRKRRLACQEVACPTPFLRANHRTATFGGPDSLHGCRRSSWTT